jgi:hypothetical protein
MALQDLLRDQRDRLVAEWLARVAACDPDPSSRLLKGHHDRFRNPIWYAYDQALPVVFEELIGDMDRARIASVLDPVMHIRTVEALSPTEATSFILLLKDVVQDALRGEGGDATGVEAWRAFGSRVDEVALVAFELFVACQEKLQRIKASEAARRAQLAERIAAADKASDVKVPSGSRE